MIIEKRQIYLFFFLQEKQQNSSSKRGKDVEKTSDELPYWRIPVRGKWDGVGYSICRVGSASGLTFRSSLPRVSLAIEASVYHNPDWRPSKRPPRVVQPLLVIPTKLSA